MLHNSLLNLGKPVPNASEYCDLKSQLPTLKPKRGTEVNSLQHGRKFDDRHETSNTSRVKEIAVQDIRKQNSLNTNKSIVIEASTDAHINRYEDKPILTDAARRERENELTRQVLCLVL